MVALTPDSDRGPNGAAPAQTAGGVRTVPALRILVVDDDTQVRMTLQMMLEHFGHRVELAEDGEHALALASQRPDMIICDVNMPGANGYEVLEAIRRDVRLRETPFIFLTGLDDHRNMRQGMSLGADDYLTKPFSIDELNASIRACYSKHADLRHRLRQLAEVRRRVDNAAWSHELLTPIHGVLGFAAMLEEEADTITRDELRWMAKGIRKSGERQLALAKKILRHHELARCREASGPLPRVMTASEVLEKATTAVVAAGERKMDLMMDCAAANVALPENWVETIAAELVENACKFSSGGTPIVVRGTVAGGRYRFEVRDAGIGMTPEERGAIGPFRQFRREQHEQQGLGLGLSLVQEIAALHQGSLRLSPGMGGAGLHVTVELPLAVS